MSKTLLQMTQEILTVMTSDEVNSITDSAEAEAVATIITSVFEDMVSNRNWPHLRQLIKLESLSDDEKPTHLKLPKRIKELVLINYDRQTADNDRIDYHKVSYKHPDEFLMYTNNRSSTSENTQLVTDSSGVQLLIYNDKYPQYFTSFDDDTLVFDSYDKEVDTTLKVSKFQVMAFLMPETRFEDDWIPDLPDEAFRALIAEAKSTAQFHIQTVQDIKSEQESVRQKRWLSRKAWQTNGGVRYPNYGRRGRKRYKDSTFKQDRH